MKEKQKKEALRRIKLLIKKLGLNPNVEKYFKEGKIYYSYLTAGGFLASIDTITYDERYEAVVKAFEKQYDALVYHAIETGNSIALLFVSKWESDWKYDFEISGDSATTYAYVYYFEANYGEVGSIEITGHLGVLVRIG